MTSQRTRKISAGWMLAGLVMLVWAVATAFPLLRSRVPVPRYLGKPLDVWAEEHPSKYYAAVAGLGTNAIPYLLEELAATDSPLARSAQSALARLISVGDIFVSSRHRRYYARLGFQVLDTNGVPSLVTALFSRPMTRSDSDLAFNSAWALSWVDSPAANELKNTLLTVSLFDANPDVQRNAILAWTIWASPPTLPVSRRIETCLLGTNASLREAAVGFFAGCHTNDQIAVPALVRCLQDPDTNLRQLAWDGLYSRGSNGVPRLLDALAGIPTNHLESRHLRSELIRCIKQIDPRLDP